MHISQVENFIIISNDNVKLMTVDGILSVYKGRYKL